MSGFDAVDLFAGPGGWDTAAAVLGVRTVGIETNPLACATARAAGHVRVQRSVAELDPTRFRRAGRGLIGSPPCPPFSKAGKRLGMLDQPRLFAHLDRVARAGEWVSPDVVDPAFEIGPWHDEGSPLTLEPLRWALALRPEWIALEQVPDVLPFWERLAVLLRTLGYTAWCGVLDSEMYGVPQTRDRAILIASRVGHNVSRPPATHHRFRPGQTPTADLFDDLLPWVSMADALGWGFTDEPACTVSSGGTETGGAEPFANAGYRRRLASWVFTNNDSRTAGGGKERFHRSTDAPSPTISGQVRSWSVRFGNQEHSAVRSVDEPAATIRYSERMNACDWIPSYRSNRPTGRGGNVPRPGDQPAPTVDCQGQATWVHDAPATTVQGDPRIAPRGHHDRQFNGETVRVSVEEAACLQSFPDGYPWQGSRTAQYQQIGNAVPVLLGVAVLGHLLGIEGWRDICRDAYATAERVA